MKLKTFSEFEIILEEAAPRLPVSEKYWLDRGKLGKKVALYTHDDMDGLFCAIEMKKWLLNKGFEIIEYGILNYMEGWKYTSINPQLINIVLDFANMPGDERDKDIDYYLDHHGLFSEADLEKYKKSPVQKKATSSAYEAVCLALGTPLDELTLSVIDMIDAAKYQKYGVSWQRLLDFNLSEIKKSKEVRLEFAAAFNQFLKRSDHRTLIAVIENCKDASIYSIFHVMLKIYPEHNIVPKTGEKVDFVSDSQKRLATMKKRTIGKERQKKKYMSQNDFMTDWKQGLSISPSGYQLIGDLVFVPTGTWANALRARTIVEEDFMGGFLPSEPKFILLQYGGTLQVCSYKTMSETENLPVLKSGQTVNDLGHYMIGLLENFRKYFGYYDPDTSIGQDEITVSGGHGGIGSISNIFGTCKVKPFDGLRFIDMFKNKIITDLSGVEFKISTKWSEPREYAKGEPEMDNKKIQRSDVLKLDSTGRYFK